MFYPQSYHRRFDASPTPQSPLVLTGAQLRHTLLRALIKHALNEPAGCLVYLAVANLAQSDEQPDAAVEAALVGQLGRLVQQSTGALFVGYEGAGRMIFFLSGDSAPQPKLERLARRIVGSDFTVGDRAFHLTPAIGYVSLKVAGTLEARSSYALAALSQAQLANDLQPVCYRPTTGAASATARGSRLSALRKRISTPFQIVVSALLGFVAPFLIFVTLSGAGFDITPAIYLGTVLILLVTSYLVWYEGFQAIRTTQPPEEPTAPYPPASAIIAAYLPNEAATIIETLRTFLRLDYPGQLEVLLAYNTPHDLAVEAELQALARLDPRLRLLRVPGSSSKAQNVNAALAHVGGSFVGVFDADHHPAPDSFTRAWRWLANGYDIVQGHCVIRNGDDSWITRLVSVEFETIYAVAHPGRARMHGFGVFGGSNGYWRTEVLRGIRMRSSMLTEDIDASMRALLEGYKIASDPLLLSHELAPLTLQSLWTQRMRWAQGWFQVSLKHTWAALRSPILSVRQKLGVFHLLVWRELYPWLSIQILTLLAFWLWNDGLVTINLLIPIFVLTTLLTFSSGPGQVLFAYLLGSPAIRRQWRWYLVYLVSTSLYYSGFKNLISRVAMIKEAMQEKQWKVTPRAQSAERT